MQKNTGRKKNHQHNMQREPEDINTYPPVPDTYPYSPGYTLFQRPQASEPEQQSIDIKYYLAIFFIQCVLTFCNLYFAYKNQKSDCMDKNLGTGLLVLRPWLLAMGYTQIAFMALFLLLITCLFYRLIDECFKLLVVLLIFFYLIKMVVWAFVEFDMFISGLKNYCSGVTYAYLLILTIIHALILLLYLILKVVRCLMLLQ